MKYRQFEELPVWQKARDLAIQIYKITQQGKFVRDFAFTTQIRKSSISVPSNIAEGFERGSRKEFIQFLYIAKASAGELRSQLVIAADLGYLDVKISKLLKSELIQTSEQLGALILSLKRNIN
ncbi:MAG TPA: four helix bundle protein [Terriglobales bacterium]|nr:four helix bundle protein [Terriglobales bacterium]